MEKYEEIGTLFQRTCIHSIAICGATSGPGHYLHNIYNVFRNKWLQKAFGSDVYF